MQVLWLEQTVAEVSREADWLNPRELARLGQMRVAKRREDWRLGRWTAKQAVALFLELPNDPATLATIEIIPADSGAPFVCFENSAPVSISLTHREGRAACAIAEGGVQLGCDLEIVEPRCDAFVSDYFTPQEQQLVERVCVANGFRLLALLWSAKESALKALQTGLRLDTRSIAIDLGEEYDQLDRAISLDSELSSCKELWHPFRAIHSSEQLFDGWWQLRGEIVRTLVSAPQSPPPRCLKNVS